MYIGAIVTIAGEGAPGNHSSGLGDGFRPGQPASPFLFGAPAAYTQILGKTILDRTVERLRLSGVEQVSVISEGSNCESHELAISSTEHTAFWSAWDRVVWRYLSQGMDALLLVRLGPYVELDLPDLIRFHQQTGSALTQVCNSRGLDLLLVDAAGLRNEDGNGSFRQRLSAMIASRRRYHCTGYINRLLGPADFRQLTQDALLGRCDIRPIGQEIEPGVWLGEDAHVDSTARIETPAYIGAGTTVCGSSIITGASSVEQHCHVDYGTTVDRSCVLPGTYLGMGLQFTNAVVAGPRLFHLRRNLEVQIRDQRLLGTWTQPHQLISDRLVRKAASLLSRGEDDLPSTQRSQTASVEATRWLGGDG